MKYIKIKNARENNLKDVSIEIPRNQIVVFTGVSGSGKSSLVFDTINAQAKRELYDILGTYAQSRLPKISKPDCDSIENLSPSIVLKQKRNLSNSRSTVGTVTEIYTYLRLLFSRIGEPFIGPSTYFSFNSIDGMCLNCNGTGLIQDIDLEKLIDRTKSLNDGAILFPDFKVNGWQWKYIAHTGFFDRDLPLNQYSKSDFEKLLYGKESNIQINSGEFGLSMNYEGLVSKINKLYINKNQDSLSSKKKQKIQAFLFIKNCNSCNGASLNQRALQVMINKHNIDTISHLQISNLKAFISEVMEPSAKIIIEKIKQKAQNLIDIGLGYLSLSRNTSTLSGGEYQRVKLATQLDSSLTEMIYILDEPSVGLHPKDVYQLNHLIKILKEKGNSLLIMILM